MSRGGKAGRQGGQGCRVVRRWVPPRALHCSTVQSDARESHIGRAGATSQTLILMELKADRPRMAGRRWSLLMDAVRCVALHDRWVVMEIASARPCYRAFFVFTVILTDTV